MSIGKKKKVFVAMSPKQFLRNATGQAGGLSSKKTGRVFVAMSGGVDSSVAALLLKKRGYDCVGVFMRCYNLDGCAERDAEDARRVAEKLQMPFYVWDFEEEYKKRVVDYMIDGYRKGITPNPDVMCNKEIKFGLFLKKALAMGADYVVTGHYVRLKQFSFLRTGVVPAPAVGTRLHLGAATPTAVGDRARRASDSFPKKKIIFALFAAKDKNKDQSYFLWTLTQEQLKHCLFPIGDYLKSEVRRIARETDLPTAEKKDSQGICFLGKISLPEFLKKHIPERRGPILTTDGKKIGEHYGAQFYTIGQRHLDADFQFPKTRDSKNRKPVYVADKNVKKNTLTVTEGKNSPALYRKEVNLGKVNLLDGKLKIKNIERGIPVFARIRYRQPLALAILSIRNSRFAIRFNEPVKFVAPGQSAVFYKYRGLGPGCQEKLELLGGGIIL